MFTEVSAENEKHVKKIHRLDRRRRSVRRRVNDAETFFQRYELNAQIQKALRHRSSVEW